MEENLPDLMVHIFSQEHQSNHLKRSETLEFCPLDVEIEQVSSLLLFFGIGADLLDRSIDQVLSVPVNGSQVSSCHHLVVAGDATIALLLVF